MLHKNQIQKIPTKIQYSNLESLYLADNKIDNISEGPEGNISVKYIDLQNNLLSKADKKILKERFGDTLLL